MVRKVRLCLGTSDNMINSFGFEFLPCWLWRVLDACFYVSWFNLWPSRWRENVLPRRRYIYICLYHISGNRTLRRHPREVQGTLAYNKYAANTPLPRHTDLGHRSPQVSIKINCVVSPYRRFPYLAGRDSIDRLSLSLSCLSLRRDGNLRGNRDRARKRQKYTERSIGGGTQLYSVRWNGNHFISPFVKKVVPYQTFSFLIYCSRKASSLPSS